MSDNKRQRYHDMIMCKFANCSLGGKLKILSNICDSVTETTYDPTLERSLIIKLAESIATRNEFIMIIGFYPFLVKRSACLFIRSINKQIIKLPSHVIKLINEINILSAEGDESTGGNLLKLIDLSENLTTRIFGHFNNTGKNN